MAKIVTEITTIASLKKASVDAFDVLPRYSHPDRRMSSLAKIFKQKFKYFCVCDCNYVFSPSEDELYAGIKKAFDYKSLYLAYMHVDFEAPLLWGDIIGYGALEISPNDTAKDIRLLVAEENDKYSPMGIFAESVGIFLDTDVMVGWVSTFMEIAIFAFLEREQAKALINCNKNITFLGSEDLGQFMNKTENEINERFGRMRQSLVH